MLVLEEFWVGECFLNFFFFIVYYINGIEENKVLQKITICISEI